MSAPGKHLLVQEVPGRIANAQTALQVWTLMSFCGALRLSHRAPNWQNVRLEVCSDWNPRLYLDRTPAVYGMALIPCC